MRKFLVIIIVVMIGAMLAAGTYSILTYHESELSIDGLATHNLKVENGIFTGEARAVDDGYEITDYKCRVEDGQLYFTVYVSRGSANALPKNADGYVELKYECGEITKVWYEAGDRKSNIGFEKK